MYVSLPFRLSTRMCVLLSDTKLSKQTNKRHPSVDGEQLSFFFVTDVLGGWIINAACLTNGHLKCVIGVIVDHGMLALGASSAIPANCMFQSLDLVSFW